MEHIRIGNMTMPIVKSSDGIWEVAQQGVSIENIESLCKKTFDCDSISNNNNYKNFREARLAFVYIALKNNYSTERVSRVIKRSPQTIEYYLHMSAKDRLSSNNDFREKVLFIEACLQESEK